jgi:hypothetical protein
VAQGQQQASLAYGQQLQQAVAQLRSEFDTRINQTAGGLRKQAKDEIDRRAAAMDQQLSSMAEIAKALNVTTSGSSGGPPGGDPGLIRIENMPGTRVPYIALVEIPILQDDTSEREQDWLVTQDGPFIAVRRWATFLSAIQFEVTDSLGVKSTLPGRTNGRYRPVHSADDILDGAVHNASPGEWYIVEGGGSPAAGHIMPGAVLSLPNSASSSRSMQFDGRVQVRDDGTQFPRQNRPAPSSWWATGNNGPVELGALDVYERGTNINFKVQPNHVLNPSYGNAFGQAVFPNAPSGFPFSAGQFDPHEGIATPSSVVIGPGGAVAEYVPRTDDNITRLPSGFFIIALEGYRILQTTRATR